MVNTSKVREIYLILNSPITGKVLSGSDKIFLKLSLLIKNQGNFKIKILTCPEGLEFCRREFGKKSNIEIILINNLSGKSFGIINLYILRILYSTKLLFFKIPPNSIIISTSDFLTDFIPLLVIYLKYGHQNSYFSSMFMRKEKKYNETIYDFLYRKSQEINLILTKFFKFKIFTNPIDLDYLENKGIEKSRIITLIGGVEEYNLPTAKTKKYDACFVGRINPIKGIPRMLEIWKEYVNINPLAKLAMVCSGSVAQEKEIKELIKRNRLDENIEYLGFLDNEEKYKLLSESKMFLLPSFYESFGIVVIEALSMKLPVICFDLNSLRFNFKDLLLFSEDSSIFLKNIIKVSENTESFQKKIEDGYKFSKNFTWNKTLEKFLIDLV